MKKLNGWQRIGVAITILWLPLGILWFDKLEQRDSRVAATALYSSCTAMNESFPRLRANPRDCVSARDRLKAAYLQGESTRVAVQVLVPIPAFWLLGWLLLKIVTWIRVGFKAKQ